FSEWTEWYWSLHPTQGGWIELTAYLGGSVMAAAVVGLSWCWRNGRRVMGGMWVLVGGVFYLLSLGPVLLVLGHDLQTVPTLYGVLESIVPIMSMAGVASRMALVTYLSAAVLAALGVAVAARRWPV